MIRKTVIVLLVLMAVAVVGLGALSYRPIVLWQSHTVIERPMTLITVDEGELCIAHGAYCPCGSKHIGAANWSLTVPIWLVSLVLAGYPAFTVSRSSVGRWRRRSKGLCLECGYDLTGNVSGVCPECGVPSGPLKDGGVSSGRVVRMIFLSAVFGGACGALSHIVPTAVYCYARRGSPPSLGLAIVLGVSFAIPLTPIAVAFLRRRNLASAAVRMFAFGCPVFLLGEAFFDCLWAFGRPTVGFPLSFAIALIAAYALPLPAIAFVLRRGHGLPGHCPSCGYDLTGNISGVCPECGERT